MRHRQSEPGCRRERGGGRHRQDGRATGAALVAIHHEPRGGEHLFGSIMLDATYDAQIHVERGNERAWVIVTIQELENAPILDKPFAYRIQEEYFTRRQRQRRTRHRT